MMGRTYEEKIWAKVLAKSTADLASGTDEAKDATRKALAGLHEVLFGGTHEDGIREVKKEEYQINISR